MPNMTELLEIPFVFDWSAFSARVRLERCPGAVRQARGLAERAAPLLAPKALFRPCSVTSRSAEEVGIEEVTFRSPILSAKLQEAERVFAYVATCGTGLEAVQAATEDLLARYWLDALKEMALEAAVMRLREHLQERFALPGLSSLNPGSGEAALWPITQQRGLFALLGEVERRTGVRLGASCLMQPNKTVSGILFPTEVPFETCQHCGRPDCPRRRAPYAGVLFAAGH